MKKYAGWLGAAVAGALIWVFAEPPDLAQTWGDPAVPEITLVPRAPIVLAPRRGRTPRVTATGTPTTTSTPTATRPRPTGTPPPTPTAVPPANPVRVYLRAVSWQWDFVCASVPCPPGVSISQTPAFPGMNTLTVAVGLTVELWIYNGGPSQEPGVANHTFSGIPALGLTGIPYPGLIPLPDGGNYVHGPSTTFTATPDLSGSSIFFNCDDTACSTGNIAQQHDLMHGWINISP